MKRHFAFLLAAMLLVLTGCEATKEPFPLVQLTEAASAGGGLIDPLLGDCDWLELHNSGSMPLDLTGWQLTDKLKEPERFVFPQTVLEPGAYLVLVCGGISGLREDGVLCTGFSLSKSGEEVLLLNPRGDTVLHVTLPPLPEGITYALDADGSYGYARPSPGRPAERVCATLEDAMLPENADSLRITEVLPRPTRGEPWAELMNSGDKPLELSSYRLSDDPRQPLKWQLPDRVLEPGEYWVVSLSGRDSDDEASFSLNKAETGLYLYDMLGNPMDTITWPETLQPDVCVTPDGYTAQPTPGEENTGLQPEPMRDIQPSEPLHISEALVRNQYSICDRDGDRSPWVELYNSSEKRVELRDYWLSDDGKNLFAWRLPEKTLAPGDYCIVFLSGKASSEGELHTHFSLSRGETLYLTNKPLLACESLHVPEELEKNISLGLENGRTVYYGLPTPGTANNGGITAGEGVFISEVCTASSIDEDWIELYNGTDAAVLLENWRITQDAAEEGALLTGSVEPGEYRLLQRFADFDFGLAAEGDTVLLYDDTGVLRDFLQTGGQKNGISAGRTEASSQRVYFTKPTPGAANAGECCSGWTDMPLFSTGQLYFSDAATVEITCTTPGAEIRYTDNGTDPLRYGKVYTQPITLNRSRTLRAVAVSPGLVSSAENAVTCLKTEAHTVPVVCISGNSWDLEKTLEKSTLASKPDSDVYIQYYSASGELKTAFPANIHAKGRGSMYMHQKSIQISLKSGLGRSSVSYPFFGEMKAFTGLELRNAGQDSSYARMRDSLFTGICSPTNVYTFKSHPVVVYVNGAYWGLYDLKEDVNVRFFSDITGCSERDITIMERENATVGDAGEYSALCKEIRTWKMEDPEEYRKLGELVDIEACMDTLLCRIWWGDIDCTNLVFWKAKGGKWAPVLVDMDWCLPEVRPVRGEDGTTEIVSAPTVLPNMSEKEREELKLGSGTNTMFLYRQKYPKGLDGSSIRQDIYAALWRSPIFREEAYQRMQELGRTVFVTENVLAAYDVMHDTLAPEMEQQTRKWDAPSSVERWERHSSLLRKWMGERREIVLLQTEKYMRAKP